jgi:hypothetical protein
MVEPSALRRTIRTIPGDDGLQHQGASREPDLRHKTEVELPTAQIGGAAVLQKTLTYLNHN